MRERRFPLRYAAFGVAVASLAVSFSAKRDGHVAQAAPVFAKAPAAASIAARLPWAAGTSVYLTQDADDDCCSDHVGSNKWAYDFAAYDGSAFDVLAPQAGTVVHVKMSSKSGCGDAKCVNDANYVVIDHGDGTQTTMLHLAYGSLDPAIKCGAFVRRGQRIAVTGSTGWSTGVHLHVERDPVKKNLKKVCGCGPDGMACAPSTAEWSLFWPSLQQPNLPTRFAEWANADSPKNRRGMVGPSTNVDEHEDVVTLPLDGRFTAKTGDWADGGAFRHAPADGKAAAVVGLKGAVKKAGVYEVWARAPLGTVVPMADTTITLTTGKGTTSGILAGGTPGGAYHPVLGLERVVLDGSEDSLTFSSATPNEGKRVIADSIVLRRTGPVSSDSLEVAKK